MAKRGKPRAKPRRRKAAKSRGLSAEDCRGGEVPAAAKELAAAVERAGGVVLAPYREPLMGQWHLFAALPIDAVSPTPYQRDVSETHVKRLSGVIEKIGRFLDPVVAVAAPDGGFWTPNGMHRLEAMKRLGARAVTALLVPEREVAYQILALNTEKAHNLKERSLEVIRMYRGLLAGDGGKETDHVFYFEDPSFATLGICYEAKPRFSGGAYHPVLRRVDEFLEEPLSRAIRTREARAAKVQKLEEHVAAAVEALKARGMESPYLRAFVVARINPIRFVKEVTAEFDEIFDTMIERARKFDAARIKTEDVARTFGAPAAAE